MPAPASLRESVPVWARVAALSFGGPAGQIAVMHRILVEEKAWVDERRFLHALNYCMLLPGPEAQQLATYLGWMHHGTVGGLLAGGLFILPGFVSILALSLIYAGFHDVPAVGAAFFGLKAAVVAVVVEAGLRIGKRVLVNDVMRAVALAAFVAIFAFHLPFPLIVASAIALGLVGHRFAPGRFVVIKGAAVEVDAPVTRPAIGATLRTAATWLAVWLVPVAVVHVVFGPDHVYSQLAAFFSQAAVVTFGGAYSVLAYIAQQAVETHGWLEPHEMLDGLGLAETTPGPLIQVVQFVGFLAAWRDPGGLPPWAAGVVGSVLTTWVTFAPSFLWIFTGAPYVEWMRGNERVSAALSTITAAVVGVVVNLALWFAVHVAFAEVGEIAGPFGARVPLPVWSTLDLPAVAIAIGASISLFKFHLGVPRTLAGAVGAGLLWRLLVVGG